MPPDRGRGGAGAVGKRREPGEPPHAQELCRVCDVLEASRSTARKWAGPRASGRHSPPRCAQQCSAPREGVGREPH